MLDPAPNDHPVTGDQVLLDCEEVRSLIDEGHEQGCLDTARIADALRDLEVTPDQLDELLLALADLGIDVIEAEDAKIAVEEDNGDAVPSKLDLSVKTASTDPVRVYFMRWARCRCSPLSKSLAGKRIERRDMAAKRKLIEANLRLVVSIASGT